LVESLVDVGFYFAIYAYSIGRISLTDFGVLGVFVMIGSLFRSFLIDPIQDYYVVTWGSGEKNSDRVENAFILVLVFGISTLLFLLLALSLLTEYAQYTLIACIYALNIFFGCMVAFLRQKLLLIGHYTKQLRLGLIRSVSYFLFAICFLYQWPGLLGLLFAESIGLFISLYFGFFVYRYRFSVGISLQNLYAVYRGSRDVMFLKITRQLGFVCLVSLIGWFGGLQSIGIYNRLDAVFRGGRKLFSRGIVDLFYVKYAGSRESRSLIFWVLTFLYLAIIYVAVVAVFFGITLSYTNNLSNAREVAPLFALFWFSMGVASFNIKAMKADKLSGELYASGLVLATLPNVGVVLSHVSGNELFIGWAIGGVLSVLLIINFSSSKIIHRGLANLILVMGLFAFFIMYYVSKG
jgi:hypothetical protein